MTKFINPQGVVKPFSRYSHAALVPGGYRWLHISGQVGATPDGRLAEGFEAQARQTWHNIIGCLKAAGMDVGDIVKINQLLTRAQDVGASRKIRDEMLEGHAPASTLLVVSALAHPALLVEIEAVAAKPEPTARPVSVTAPKGTAKAPAKTKAKPKAKRR